MTHSPHRAVRGEELVGIVGWPQPTSKRLVEAWRELGIHAGMLSPVRRSTKPTSDSTAEGEGELMRQHGVSHLVVVSNGEEHPVGILSTLDIGRVLGEVP